MNKLVINSVKINSVNGQTLPLKEFAGGFNIICGANEAGKSTMMKFLKEALFSPKDLTGDIELEKSGIKYLVKVDGKKSKNARLKVLSPENKSIEEVLEGFDRNFYQRAFTINLDDINAVDSELFSLIQDHNAPALTDYKSKLEGELREYLTENWKPNKKLTGLVKMIADIDSRIRELSGKEEEYSKNTSSIAIIKREIENISKLIENKKLFAASVDLKMQFDKLQEETETIKKTFNQKLFDNKQLFYELSKKTELIIGYFEEINQLAASKTKQEIDEQIGGIKLRYNVELNLEQAVKLDVSRETEERVRELISEIENRKNNLANLGDKKQDLINNIQKINDEIDNLKSRVGKLQISDINSYETSVNELKSAVSSLTGMSENFDVNLEGARVALRDLFLSVFLVCLGIFMAVSSSVVLGIVVVIAGLILGGLALPMLFNRNDNNKASEIYDYLKAKVMPVLNRTEFLHTAPALDRIAYECEGKLNEYKALISDIDNREKTLVSGQKELADIEDKMRAVAEGIDECTSSLKTLTAVNDKVLPPKGFIDFLEEIRVLRELLTRSETENGRKKALEDECNKYLTDFAGFLSAAGFDNSLSPMFLREKICEIQKEIEENDKLKNRIEDNSLRMGEIEQKLLQVTVEDNSPDKSQEELEGTYETLINERARLMQDKKGLEEFEGLVGLRNDRNLLQNRLNDIVNDLYSKKLALNIIEYAEKQQRAIEPNLMSAEKLLKEITDGKYISANFANKTITSADGETKEENELSRGTKEQLYLAFRLGYALNYGNDGTKYRLPLIIDDAFVNFDKERLSHVLNALVEFAKTNQVLFFTCHKDYILSLAGVGVNVVDI